MDAMLTVEPFGFFTLDALRAGWYMVWRQLVRVAPVAAGALVVGGVLGKVGFALVGILIMGLGLAAVIWGAVLVPQLTSRWAGAPVAMPAPPVSPAAGRSDDKRQCPKCGLCETERGSVIGWYCTTCGWRETRR